MGFEPTTFCMASRTWGTGVGYNVPANERFLGRLRAACGSGISRRFTAIRGLIEDRRLKPASERTAPHVACGPDPAAIVAPGSVRARGRLDEVAAGLLV
jgi:hypothetical protein